jgi:hypothetical protein
LSALLQVTVALPLASVDTSDTVTPPANISLVLGEVTFQYTPNLGYTFSGTIPIAESYYLFPRVSSVVQYPCS